MATHNASKSHKTHSKVETESNMTSKKQTTTTKRAISYPRKSSELFSETSATHDAGETSNQKVQSVSYDHPENDPHHQKMGKQSVILNEMEEDEKPHHDTMEKQEGEHEKSHQKVVRESGKSLYETERKSEKMKKESEAHPRDMSSLIPETKTSEEGELTGKESNEQNNETTQESENERVSKGARMSKKSENERMSKETRMTNDQVSNTNDEEMQASHNTARETRQSDEAPKLKDSELSKRIHKLTECSICLEPFKQPKELPCVHTFCLKCLRTHYKHSIPGVDLECPICKETFKIPSEGLEKLPSNMFVNKMVLLRELIHSQSTSCDWCSASGIQEQTHEYCIDCGQSMCEKCSAAHNNIKIFKNHDVLNMKDADNFGEQIKMMARYCEQHPDEHIKLYCNDCKVTTCLMCYVEKHNKHDCIDVKKSAEKFSHQVKEDIDKVGSCIVRGKHEVDEMDTIRQEFVDRVTAVNIRISQKFDHLIALLKSQQSMLTEELNSFRDKNLREYEESRNQMEKYTGIMEEFRAYCQDVNDIGTACDVSCVAHILHTRTEQLVEIQETHCPQNLSKVEILFTPSTAQENAKNLIGQLVFTGIVLLLLLFILHIIIYFCLLLRLLVFHYGLPSSTFEMLCSI